MMTKLELIEVLKRIPGNPIVTLWDEQYKEDVDVRRVMLCPSGTPGATTIVLTAEPITPRGLNVLATWYEED